jgi:hypothetical protein
MLRIAFVGRNRGAADDFGRLLRVPAETTGWAYALARFLDLDSPRAFAVDALRYEGDVADRRRLRAARAAAVQPRQDAQASRERDQRSGDRDPADDPRRGRPLGGKLELPLRLLEGSGANDLGEGMHVLAEAGALAAAADVCGQEQALELRQLAVDLV